MSRRDIEIFPLVLLATYIVSLVVGVTVAAILRYGFGICLS